MYTIYALGTQYADCIGTYILFINMLYVFNGTNERFYETDFIYHLYCGAVVRPQTI